MGVHSRALSADVGTVTPCHSDPQDTRETPPSHRASWILTPMHKSQGMLQACAARSVRQTDRHACKHEGHRMHDCPSNPVGSRVLTRGVPLHQSGGWVGGARAQRARHRIVIARRGVHRIVCGAAADSTGRTRLDRLETGPRAAAPRRAPRPASPASARARRRARCARRGGVAAAWARGHVHRRHAAGPWEAARRTPGP